MRRPVTAHAPRPATHATSPSPETRERAWSAHGLASRSTLPVLAPTMRAGTHRAIPPRQTRLLPLNRGPAAARPLARTQRAHTAPTVITPPTASTVARVPTHPIHAGRVITSTVLAGVRPPPHSTATVSVSPSRLHGPLSPPTCNHMAHLAANTALTRGLRRATNLSPVPWRASEAALRVRALLD